MTAGGRSAADRAPVPLRREGDVTYRIARHGAMRVDAVLFASEAITAALEAEDHASLRQLQNVASLPGVVEPVLAMPDVHWGYGFPIGGVAAFDPDAGGVVSPGGVGYDINCGVRLLASNLSGHDLEAHREALADALFEGVPAGMGARPGTPRLDQAALDGVLAGGADWVVRHGMGEPEDVAHVEYGGALPGAVPERVSARARQRGAAQLGSLGSGNHFLEVQVVERVFDPEAAGALGLAPDDVTVLIHSGSRGLGHQVCSEHVEACLAAARRYGIELPDPQLAAAPIDSEEGRAYLEAMAAAANFAYGNRQRLTHLVRGAFERAGLAPKQHGLRVVYDLAHNHAAFETHGGRRLLVHRKGATRAFGPHHPDLPGDYAAVGQPVFVPGDMGRASYVLVGTDGAMRDAFGSCCHGAGRVLGRRRARKEARGRDVTAELAARGVTVRTANRGGLAEEASFAYKDVDAVVDAVARAGLGRRVARLRPRIVIKG